MEAFYKLAYDISCYYAFAAFFLSYGMKYDVPAYSFLVLFAACFLAVYSVKLKNFSQVVQIVAFVLPVIPFLLETNLWGKLVLILPWAYMVMTVLRQGYYITYRRFKKTYLIFFWIYVAVFVFFIAENRIKGEVAMIVTGPFIVMLLVSGIFLLQMLRFQEGTGDKKKLEKYQWGQLVIFMIAAIILTAGNVVELLYLYVFYPLSKMLLGAGMAVVVYIVSMLDSPLKPPKEIGDVGTNLKEFFEERQEALENVETIWGKIPEKIKEEIVIKEPDYAPVFIIFAIVAAIVIFAVMFGDTTKKRKPAAIEDDREDCFEEVALKEVLKKRFVRPEIVIRYYYREFMKKSEAKKHRLEASDTTKEILTKYKTWNEVTPEQTTEAGEVTSLYQKTRYSKAKITQADANRMKALVKRL